MVVGFWRLLGSFGRIEFGVLGVVLGNKKMLLRWVV